MPTIPEALTIALQHHQAGRLQAAEQIYRQILQADPNHAEAIHLLGVIAHQAGHHAVAVEYIERAIELRGDVASFHYNLGTAYHALARFSDAINSNRRALELKPDYAEAHNNLGNALQTLGSLDEAVGCYQRAAELKPDFTEAHLNLGNALKDLGRTEEAVACYRRALQVSPASAAAHLNLGNALKDLGNTREAVASYQRALEADPGFAPAHNNLGNAFKEQGKLDDAAECFHRALAIAPAYPEAHANLGNTFREQGRLEDAIACARRALALKPDFAEAHDSLGSALVPLRRVEEAVVCFRRALELKPAIREGRKNLGIALLMLGQYEEGWREYEHRLDYAAERREFSTPRWNGERVEGKTILIHSEQGFGDALQLVRYAPLVAPRSGARRVLLEAEPGLHRLFSQIGGGRVEVVPVFEKPATCPEAFDLHIPLMSLPLALRAYEPMSAPGGYLRGDEQLRRQWRDRLGEASSIRVGLAWTGSPRNKMNAIRSIPPELLSPLLKLGRFQFYSLQILEDGRRPAGFGGAGLIDLTEHLVDFADTAAFIAELDLVITVETSLAHLAGALGGPVWTLLPFHPDWRWGVEGESTPWYPAMRLFRQSAPGDWDSVLRSVAGELAILASRPDAPHAGSRAL